MLRLRLSHFVAFLLPAIGVCGLGFIATPSSATQILYWTDGNSKIERSNLDGSDAQDVVTGLDQPNGIAYHPGESKIYWANGNGTSPGTIQRANLDGSSIETVVSGLDLPWGIALDAEGNKLYWADNFANKVQRANLDGTNVEDLIDFGVGHGITSVALDIAAGQMYLGLRTGDVNSPIHRANLDGSGLESLLPSFDEDPTQAVRGLALDLTSGFMYWTNSAGNWRADLDGNDPQLLYSSNGSLGGIAINGAEGKLYFTNESDGSILRSDLDGSGVEIIIPSGQDPRGIAIVPEPSTALLLASGLVTMAVGRRRRRV